MEGFSANPDTRAARNKTKTNAATSETWMFQYDALGNLVTVGLPNGDLVEYLVDGLGRRVGKKKNGVLLKQFIYRDTLTPVAELDGVGNLVSVFVYGSKPNVPDYILRGGATYRIVSDHLGSPREAINVASIADVPFRAAYRSFGQATGTGIEWMPFGFAGGLYDPDTGLVRYGARDYDSATGRWLAKDPVRFDGGTNLYVYAANDPINYLDRDGRGPLSAFLVFAGCELWSLKGLINDLHNFSLIQDEINQYRFQRDTLDREITRRQACGEDILPLLEVRVDLDAEILRLGKALAKASPWGDMLTMQLVCIPATILAGIIPVKILP